MDSTGSTADTDSANSLHQDIELYHKALQRALKCIIKQAPNLREKDTVPFLQYCRLFLDCFSAHGSFKGSVLFPALDGDGGLPVQHSEFLKYELEVLQLRADTFERSLVMPYRGELVDGAAQMLLDAMSINYEYDQAILYPCILNHPRPEGLKTALKKTPLPASVGNRAVILPFLTHNLKQEESERILQKSWLTKSMLSVFTLRSKKALQHSWIYQPSDPSLEHAQENRSMPASKSHTPMPSVNSIQSF